MKLFIQIPCYNEQATLAQTVAALPRRVPGVDEIHILVVDDGSTDGTVELARQLEVHHIVSFACNRGLAAAHMAGLDACMRLGADIVVNTDADNQYNAADIVKLVEPIVAGRADIVVGDRDTATVATFSRCKKLWQRLGSAVVRRVSGSMVRDSTSGFRAVNCRALSSLFVHNRFTYTLETIIQASRLGLAIENVKIRTNPQVRESRLASGSWEYIRRNGPVIFRAYSMYWPLRTFGHFAIALLLSGTILIGRFFYYYLLNPHISSHMQSLQIGVGCIVMGFIVALMALLCDLVATNRRLNEEMLIRLRRLDTCVASHQLARGEGIEGVFNTGAAPWTAQEQEGKDTEECSVFIWEHTAT